MITQDAFTIGKMRIKSVLSKMKFLSKSQSKRLYIQLDSRLQYRAIIYSSRGQKIHSSTNQSVLEVEALQPGIYLLEIQDLNSGNRIIERIYKDY